ncbi:MAG: helix-turn-helix transcriptional regulator [Lactobacillaceae bacterium]|jgi:transcriptional regulator with XRE-family HTH domain|nr:helix-turn-helix transcriptional regulator [Lactobacillaceae bacterium]
MEYIDIKKSIKNISRLIKNVRLSQGISIGELSKKSDVSKSTISKFESGETVVNLFNFIQILNSLGIKLSEIEYLIYDKSVDLIQMIEEAKQYYDYKNINGLNLILEQADDLQMEGKYIQANYIARTIHALIDHLMHQPSKAFNSVSKYLVAQNYFTDFDITLIKLGLDLFSENDLKIIK